MIPHEICTRNMYVACRVVFPQASFPVLLKDQERAVSMIFNNIRILKKKSPAMLYCGTFPYFFVVEMKRIELLAS